jgi:hypothetical protein
VGAPPPGCKGRERAFGGGAGTAEAAPLAPATAKMSPCGEKWPGRIRRALPHMWLDELVAAPDCGMKYLPRASAYGKLESLVAGAEQVRAEG